MNLEQFIMDNTSMTLEETRAYLREIEMDAWRQLDARNKGAAE